MEKWNKITIDTTTEAVDAISYQLEELGIKGIEIIDHVPLSEEDRKTMYVDLLPDEIAPDDGTAKILCYIDDHADVESMMSDISVMLQDMSAYFNVGAATVSLSETKDEDWVNNWKKYFKPFRLDDHIIIKPTWEVLDDQKKDDIVVEIDPGTAFGTGSHETTKLCIHQLKKYIKEDTGIVVFESLYKDGKELAVHADIEDEGQTVKVKIPEIRTQATADGKKEITANSRVKIEDVVSYNNLTPGKEYTVKGVLMNKSTGEPLLVDGEEIRSSFTFKPDAPDGEITVTFVFDASGLTSAADIVVFESLYRDDVEIAVHADIEDKGQTVKITPPVPDVPQTGDDSNLGFWIGLGAVAVGGAVASAIILMKKKKDDDNE